MIRTGVDWSGDPGDPRHNPSDTGWMIVVGCCLAEEDTESFLSLLEELKRELGLRDDHIFKYMKSTDATRQKYLSMLQASQLQATAICIDKHTWDEEYLRKTGGPQRTIDALIKLAIAAPDSTVADQVLMIDAKRADRRFLSDLRRGMRQALRMHGRDSFKKVVPRPDDRSDAFLIQAADMISGDLRRHGIDAAPVLRYLGTARLRIERH